MTTYQLPSEPPRGTVVRIIGGDRDGRMFHRAAVDDDPEGRDSWFGVNNTCAGAWPALLLWAYPRGHLEVVDEGNDHG